jgi:SAM-dependent methyltransferase
MDLIQQIAPYKEKITVMAERLHKKPSDWKQCQKEIHDSISNIFQRCADAEKLAQEDEQEVYRLKKAFIENGRPFIRMGKYNRHVIDKPFGYHGDFLIIDEIYKNTAETEGMERCLDNYFLNTGASIATRNRKTDFKRYLTDFVQGCSGKKIRVLDLASGPCTDVHEFLNELTSSKEHFMIDCLDHDPRAIEHAKKKLGANANKINFLQKNAIRLSVAKNIDAQLPEKYDLIFSTGLFDYLDKRVAWGLISNLKKKLQPGGLMVISNYRDKWSNPSRHFMEWGGDWELVYRTEEEFLELFRASGFLAKHLSLKFESQKIMQYCFAINK